MPFEVKEVLRSVGPAASLVFAGWIFLQLLNQRYIASFDRYRSPVTDYRALENRNLERNLLFCIVVGLLLVVGAASVVILENVELKKALDSEIGDIDDMKDAAH